MRIDFNKFSLYYKKIINDRNNDKAIVFLHGFTGSSEDWEEISSRITKKANLYFIDLIGHGKSDSPNDVRFYKAEPITKQLLAFFEKIKEKKIFLLGYSMGGRVALNFAAKYSNLLKGLILESSMTGLRKKSEREKRIANDEKIIEFIKSHSVEEFVDYWMSLDIFKTQKNLSKEKLNKLRKAKIKNNKVGLINSLKGFGAGKMKPLYSEIRENQIETLLITGDLDKKYMKLNSAIKNIIPHATHKITQNAGHNVHLENPQKFAVVVNEYVEKF